MVTAIIIDDESSSRNSLNQKLKNHCPEITLLAECENGEEGIKAIEHHKPDIVLLDVEMPRMNGFTMLKQLQNRDFELIFITAYDRYAISAIKFSALDYLVKPVEIADLKTAVEKAIQKREKTGGNARLELLLQNLMSQKKDTERLALPSMQGFQFINTVDIIYLEAQSNYTILYLNNNIKFTATKTIKDFGDLLPSSVFIRIHHSYIINKNAIEKYIKGEGGQVVMRNGMTLAVSRRKKEEFLRAIFN